MEPREHVQHFRIEAASLLAACRAEPTAGVPSCPGWDRTELLTHVAGVHAWVRRQLEDGPAERVRLSTVSRPPEGDELVPFFEAGAAELASALDAMDVAATWPTWAGPQPGTFYPRRMAHEVAVHRWDAVPTPVDAELAVDGLDELLELFAPLLPADRFGGATGTIHLHATDDGLAQTGEWLVTFGRDGIAFEKGHAKGDVAVRGMASDLLLWAWNRVPVDERFEVFGDRALLDLWREAVRF
ncbi:MAG: maleylpyruvate isomerase family mycothiol-dependent enzyme [Acidimicrobiales bacterium]|nr:maleylpyruvate isomerase family mycothiol-dependent enzyme [Acidimicrobiales bacterium]